MRVVLAGYNVDSDVIEDLKKHAPARRDVTPETLSAAYARISRDPRPADVLRAVARQEVEKARRSNQAIIFKMGHHSVAEHAVFNFDIIGVSRLALEEIERFRLGSYTEKSQRYITLGDDFVVPREITDAGAEDGFVRTVRLQNALYHRLYGRLRPYVFEKHADLAANARNHSVLDGWAKEDARYAVSLATEGQVGLTVNARNLELLVRRFAARSSAELSELKGKLYDLAREVAPSIILFTEATRLRFPDLRRGRGRSRGLSAGCRQKTRRAPRSVKMKTRVKRPRPARAPAPETFRCGWSILRGTATGGSWPPSCTRRHPIHMIAAWPG